MPTRTRIIFIMRFEARFQTNIGFTFRRVLAVFTRSAITPPKVNRSSSLSTLSGAGPGRFLARSA